MAGLSRRLEAFERDWVVVTDALTIAEREADCRIVLRSARDELERQGGVDPDLPLIRQMLEIEGDSEGLQRADEALLDAWAARHGYSAEDMSRNREERTARTHAWIER